MDQQDETLDTPTPSASGREPETSQVDQPQPSNQEEQLTDQDILKNVEEIYFSSSDFDPSKYELLVSWEYLKKSLVCVW